MRGPDHGAMKTKLAFTATALTMIFLSAPSAFAATRYAAPDGDGAVATCAASDPCALEDAMNYDFVRNGDEIIVGSGEYANVGQMGTNKAISIHGAAGAPSPVIHGVNGTTFFLDNDNLEISNLVIDHVGGGSGLALVRGTGERLIVRSQDGDACIGAWATLRDTVCASEAWSGVRSGYSNPYVYTLRLRNVTAISSGSSPGSHAISIDGNQGNKITVDAKNVIAYAANPDSADVYASGGSQGATSDVVLEASNFDEVFVGNAATITAPGSNTNQTVPPLFAGFAGGDFTQAAGSPTIDAGVDDALNGTTDVTGGLRKVGAATDIGAYEFVPSPPPVDPEDPVDPANPADPTDPQPSTPADPSDPAVPGPVGTPETTITRAPRMRTHSRRAAFRFTSPGATQFECAFDGGAFGNCSSPLRVRVTRGRHTFAVRAVTVDGKTDPTPATVRWRVLRRSVR